MTTLMKRLDHDTACVCGFLLYEPIAQSDTSKLGLYNDARFPGRCILELQPDIASANRAHHIEDLSELPMDTALSFVCDIQIASEAIKTATEADRVNIAILCNREHHLHAHLIPRFSAREKYPDCSPWNDPRPKSKLSRAAVAKIKDRIYEELARLDAATRAIENCEEAEK